MAILFTGHKICSAFHEDYLRAVICRQSSLAIKLLDRSHQPIVLAPLLLQTPRQLGAHCLHRPAAEVIVNETRRPVEVTLGQIQTQRSEEHTSELQSQSNLVCRLLLE